MLKRPISDNNILNLEYTWLFYLNLNLNKTTLENIRYSLL